MRCTERPGSHEGLHVVVRHQAVLDPQFDRALDGPPVDMVPVILGIHEHATTGPMLIVPKGDTE